MQFPQNIFPLLVAYQIAIANNGALLLYSGTPAAGNLVASLAPVDGTDKYGNVYIGGLTLGNRAGKFIDITDGNGPEIDFVTDNTNISLSALIAGFTGGIGVNNVYDILQITGSRNSNNQDNVGIYMDSSNNALTQLAQTMLFYSHPSIPGGTANYVVVSAAGAQISAGSMFAVQPGTGNAYNNPAVGETWHNMTLVNTGVFAAAGAPFATPRYRIESEGGCNTVRMSGAIKLLAANGAFETFWDGPLGYRATFGQHLTCATKLNAGGNSTNVINVTNANPWQVELANVMAISDIFYLDALTFVLD